MPRELVLKSYIDEYGVRAVMGRDVLGAGEMRRMTIVQNVIDAYRSRQAAESWAKWAVDNPRLSELLNTAMKAAEGLDNG